MTTRKTKTTRKPTKISMLLGKLEGLLIAVVSSAKALVASTMHLDNDPLGVIEDLDSVSRLAGVTPPEDFQSAVTEYRFRAAIERVPLTLASDDPNQLSQAAMVLCQLAKQSWDEVGDDEHQMWFEHALPVLRLVPNERLCDDLATWIVERADNPAMETRVANITLVCRGEWHLERGEVSVAIRHARLVLECPDAEPEIIEAALNLLVECYYQKDSQTELESALMDWWDLLKAGGSPAAQAAAIDIKGVGNPYALAKAEKIRMVASLLAKVLEESDRQNDALVVYDNLCAFGYDDWMDSRFEWAGTIADRRRHGSVPLLPADAESCEDVPVRLIHANSFGGIIDSREADRVIDSLWRGPASFVTAIKLGRIQQREAVFLVAEDVSVSASTINGLLAEVTAEMVGDAFAVQTRSVHDNGAESQLVVISHNLEARTLRGVCLAVMPIQINSHVELAVTTLLFPDLQPSENERLRVAEVLSSKAESLPGFLAFRDQALAAIREAGRRLRGAPVAVEAMKG